MSQTFVAKGLTCGHCAAAVTRELNLIEGVQNVHISLVPGGPSTITIDSAPALTDEQVAAALDDAGDYRLA